MNHNMPRDYAKWDADQETEQLTIHRASRLATLGLYAGVILFWALLATWVFWSAGA
jgi:hypothetical protein